jgi:hypothetical protein
MKSQKEKLDGVKNAVELALELKDISHSTRIDEYCMARQLYVIISYKRVSINHDLIISGVKRSRSGFYHLLKEAKKTITYNRMYREVYESLLIELNLK